MRKFNIHKQWKEGATIIDPTCGRGVFLLALVKMSKKEGNTPKAEELSRLTGVELMPEDKGIFLSKMMQEYGIEFPESNFHTMDFLKFKSRNKYDIAVGNPPWINFTELHINLKESLKEVYVKYGLMKSHKEVLLGRSGQYLAALIVRKCMMDEVKENGSGYFFLPLSLFFNEGANNNFRPVEGEHIVFSVTEMFDFEQSLVFPNVGTRYGFAAMKRWESQVIPVPMTRFGLNGHSDSQFCGPDVRNG